MNAYYDNACLHSWYKLTQLSIIIHMDVFHEHKKFIYSSHTFLSLIGTSIHFHYQFCYISYYSLKKIVSP